MCKLPPSSISEQLLIQYFYEATRNLIANMAANSQQFGTRLDPLSKHVNEVNISSLEQQIAGLTSLVCQMVVGNMQMVKAYGICSVVGHPTDMCPTLQEEPIEQVILDNRKGSMIHIQAHITRDGGITLILAMGIHK